ncbi:MAG: AfsR/SARP family transcriptional regulator [Sporichthyaceae bacterium]
MDATDVPRIDIRVLGPLSVAVHGRTVAIGSPKQRAVLAMLALHRRVSLDALAEELWRETPPASVAATVHTLVSRLRRTLAGAGAGLVISADGGGYVAEFDADDQIDAQRFHDLAVQGRAAREGRLPADAARCFREALALWRGTALADLGDRDFARVAAVRLETARLDVAEDLADAELAAGRPAAALDTVEPLIREHPFRERLRGLQMLSLYRLGRQADALAAYRDLRCALADELGLEPAPSVQALERQILQQSPELDRQAPPPATQPHSGGMLAFLFTDIEASTQLWEGDRAAMAADLAQHDAILADAVLAHRGRQFAHTGDGLGAAFPTVAEALGAAIAGQRELSRTAWRGVIPLRVRMAIHAGSAQARAGTFFGPTLNRTSRLLDLACAGHILCSQAAADVGQDELPPGAALVDIGQRRLEGLSRPERVWQVAHPDLPDPAPVAGAPARRQEALTSFVGREAELAELTALLAGTRLLTILGVGGAGKTRLALELAERTDKHYADGARIVELATVRDDRPLADDVLVALGAGGAARAGASSPEEQLCQVLGDRQLLLVLDNCEHVLEAATGLVDTVLRRCPAVTVLATSREVLSVPGETGWATPGLSLPLAETTAVDELMRSDAAALFVVRARTAQPGFGPSPGNTAAITRICHSLDGIPLALELAAARVRVLDATELAHRLDDRLRLLTSGPRSAPARHQTLRAALDWSFDLLTEPEQRLLRRLSVFPQHFDLDAATAVVGENADSIDVLDLLARLIDKSLVVAEGMAETARYRLLETVRQYAAEKLGAAGEVDSAGDRHRRHFVGRVPAVDLAGTGFIDPEWAQHAAIDGENYNAALASCLAAGDFESATVILAGRGVSWFWGAAVPTTIDSIDPNTLTAGDPALHVAGLISLGAAGTLNGRWTVETVVPLYERALGIAEESGTPADDGFASFALGYAALGRGDSRAARAWMERALDCFADTFLGQIYTRHELGWIELTEGDAPAARRHFETLLTMLDTRPGSENQTAHVRAAVALCEAADGNAAQASRLARQALDESRRIPLARIEVMALIRASEVAALSGEPIGAELVEALHLLRRQGGLRWVAAALTMAAVAHEAHGRPDVAARLLGGAGHVAEMLAEDPLPVAPVAAVVTAMRTRVEGALGATACAAAETAGGRLPMPALLDLALNGLVG